MSIAGRPDMEKLAATRSCGELFAFPNAIRQASSRTEFERGALANEIYGGTPKNRVVNLAMVVVLNGGLAILYFWIGRRTLRQKAWEVEAGLLFRSLLV
jgi:hypothetical protein